MHKHNILNGLWHIDPAYAANYLPQIVAFLKGQHTPAPSEKETILSITHSSSLQSEGTPGDSSVNQIAVISIRGAITKYDQHCGPAGMVTAAGLLQECYQNEEISGIVLKIDSGGGEGLGMRVINDAVKQRNKPVVGFVDDLACSAAYVMISNADYIVANNPMARIGSIGSYMSIVDYSKQFEKEGIDIITVYASASTDKNQEVLQALKGNTKPLQELTDRFNDALLKDVEANRAAQLRFGREVWGTGKVFFAEDALKIGLIDEINSFTNILNYFT